MNKMFIKWIRNDCENHPQAGLSRDVGHVSVYERVESFSKSDRSIIAEDEIMRLEAHSAKPIMLNPRFVRTIPNHSDDPALT
jgi:hypothetical protein